MSGKRKQRKPFLEEPEAFRDELVVTIEEVLDGKRSRPEVSDWASEKLASHTYTDHQYLISAALTALSFVDHESLPTTALGETLLPLKDALEGKCEYQFSMRYVGEAQIKTIKARPGGARSLTHPERA